MKCKGIMLYYFVKINGIPKNGHFGFEFFFIYQMLVIIANWHTLKSRSLPFIKIITGRRHWVSLGFFCGVKR